MHRFFLCLLLFCCANARASTFTVTSTADPGEGHCTGANTGDGCTLREAINASNKNFGEPDTIKFDVVLFNVTQTISLGKALPNVDDDVDIIGPAAGVTVEEAGSSHVLSIFVVTYRVKASFSNLTIRKGDTGIFNASGEVILNNCTLSDNSTSGLYIDFYTPPPPPPGDLKGAADHKIEAVETTNGVVTATNCTIKDSYVGLWGVEGSAITVMGCAVNGNSYGIYTEGTLTATDCEMHDNGYGLFCGQHGITNVADCLFTDSTSDGIYNNGVSFNAMRCTLDHNNTGIGNSTSMKLTDCKIGHNDKGITSSGFLRVVSCSMNNNSSAFSNYLNGTTILSDSTFSNNLNYGLDNGGNAKIVGCQFDNNGHGAVNIRGLEAINCTFSGNDNGLNNAEGTLKTTNCTFNGNGNGIGNYISGAANIDNCIFSGNVHAGISNDTGRVAVSNCILSGNIYGIDNHSGPVTMTGCTFKGGFRCIYNKGEVNASNCTLSEITDDNGSSIYNDDNGNLTIANCTLNANSRSIYNRSTLSATNCTVSGNGIGIENPIGTFTLKNTIVAGNAAANIKGVITDGGHNLTSGTAKAAGLEVLPNGKPILKDNGGPTKTIALTSFGTAINAGDNALIPGGVTTDQRGDGYPRIIGGVVDIGAFESSALFPTISVNDAAAVKEGSATTPGSATFTVSLSAPIAQFVTVNYATADGVTNGAKAGSDYVAASGTLTFAPGETSKSVTVAFIGDDVAEQSEPFFLDINTPTVVSIADARGAVYIKNDDGPSITIEDARAVDEGNSGIRLQVFTVHLSAASTKLVTVDWATANNTAGPTDYIATSGTLTFAPGQTNKLIAVQVKGDTVVEPTETYRINLTHPIYATLGDSQAIGYIRNDDAAPLLFSAEAPSE